MIAYPSLRVCRSNHSGKDKRFGQSIKYLALRSLSKAPPKPPDKWTGLTTFGVMKKIMKTIIPSIGIAVVSGGFAPHPKPVSFRVMTYNVENLFDCYDDIGKDDSEFLPDGKLRWTQSRYNRKLKQVASVIKAVGGPDWPALVALVEVENDTVMNNLLSRTPLGKQSYRYVMTNSPDKRGIDVALLYRPELFSLDHKEEYRVHFRGERNRRTRNILHAQGRLAGGDTLDVFVCHFPSRRGGVRQSDAYRHDAATLLRTKCNEILSRRHNPFILIMGDLNSNPDESPLIETLRADTVLPEAGKAGAGELYNLSGCPLSQIPPGTTLYKGKWEQLDHIIVSGNFLKPDSRVCYRTGSAKNVVLPYLVHSAPYNVARIAPNRTYQGMHYKGGYSDHLPVVAEFTIEP